MAAGGEEKTEEPTAKKLSDARKKGNIPKSKDLAAAMLFLAGLTLLKYIGPWMAWHMKVFFEKMISVDMPLLEIPDGKEVIPFAVNWFMWLAILVGPFLFLLAVGAYLVHYYQVRWIVSTEMLKFDPNKLNPIAGFKRMFAMRNLVMLVMNMAKLAVIMSVAWWTISTEVQNVMMMVEMETMGMFVYSVERVLRLAQILAILLMVLGFADFYYQKWKHNKDLKMTKQEVKEEFKQMEGDPMVKQKRRQKQMEMAQQRMMAEVPQAEVVVRNPTHFAVAISYKPGMPAPLVVAKGKDKVAEQIIALAREHRVPLVENPPLARELYKRVEIGDHIPEELFAAVAEILTSVMNAETKQRMLREMEEKAA
ncbi:MAG: flagellar biosynthesis protein FlhB [Planctomycetaceae bacterium]|nr:flagellar biosynthesis protein FlhB [Planctomycetaceae bacterium]